MALSDHGPHREPAISRDLDGLLSWRERRALHAHLRRCAECAEFAAFQRERRAVLRSLRLMPVPETLQAFRPYEEV
jgi:anti-sigma factor RsiW